MYCDKHVVKMILETAQLLCTAHHESGSAIEGMYKATHKNHPSAKWVRESVTHYVWTVNLFLALLSEYTHRRDRVHKTSELVGLLLSPPPCIPYKEFTPPPQCMPDEYKDTDTVTAYRNYYMGDKSSIATWSWGRDKPDWYVLKQELSM